MPHAVTKTAYYFEELSDAAKDRARDWWRNLEQQDFDTSYVIEDAQRMAEILGITLSTHPIKLMGGGTRHEPTVYWSGFSSQGDGAQFEGRYRYAKGAHKRIRQEAPQDARLHAMADALLKIQRACGYWLEARCDCKGAHYSHSGWMNVEVYDGRDEYKALPQNAEEAIREVLRDFANWIYRQLEAEYEYRMADEQVDDAITANEYEFTADGRHCLI